MWWQAANTTRAGPSQRTVAQTWRILLGQHVSLSWILLGSQRSVGGRCLERRKLSWLSHGSLLTQFALRARMSCQMQSSCSVPSRRESAKSAQLRLPSFGRPLRIALPCGGLDAVGHFLQDNHFSWEVPYFFDVGDHLRAPLTALYGPGVVSNFRLGPKARHKICHAHILGQ